MRTRLFATSIIWKSSRSHIAYDLMLLLAVTAIVTFFIALPTKVLLDGAAFNLRAGYDRVVTLTADEKLASGIEVRQWTDFPVAPQSESSGGYQYTPDMTLLTVHVVTDRQAYQDHVLGSNLAEGPQGEGILLDQDSALRMGVGIGSKVALLGQAVGDSLVPQELRVAGLVRPYVAAQDASRRGLLVVPAGLLSAQWTLDPQSQAAGAIAETRLDFTYGQSESSARGVSRQSVTQSLLGQLVTTQQYSALAVVLLLATGLWCAVARRMVGRIIAETSSRRALLTALGVPPRTALKQVLLPEAAVVLLCSWLGVAAVQHLVFPKVMHRTFQLAGALPILVFLIFLSIAILVASYRWCLYTESGLGIVKSLTSEER